MQHIYYNFGRIMPMKNMAPFNELNSYSLERLWSNCSQLQNNKQNQT